MTYRNVIVTFFLGGIWHGAGWTFIIWGLIHGAAMVIHNFWSQCGFRLNKYIAWFVTFNFINISWVFFRAKDFPSANKVLSGMFSGDFVLDYHWRESPALVYIDDLNFGPWLQNIYAENKVILYIVLSMVLVSTMKNSNEIVRSLVLNKRTAIFASLLFVLSVLSMNKASEFLYFNF